MKINVTVTPDQQPPLADYEHVFIQNLSQVPDASCEEVLCQNVLDMVQNRQDALNLVHSKVKRGGKLVIGDLDLMTFATGIVTGDLTEAQACEVIAKSVSMQSVSAAIKSLQGLGLRVVNKKLNNSYYLIEGVRE